MIKITRKTTINDLNRFITKGISNGKRISDIMKEHKFLHNIYNSNRIDLIYELSHRYGKETVNTTDDDGNNLLHLSIPVDIAITNELMRSGLRLDTPNKVGTAPFHMMCTSYDKSELQYVFDVADDAKSLLALRDGTGNTPLIVAIKVGNADAAEVILKYKPNLSAVNNNGDNALFVAIKSQSKKIVKLLLNTGYKFNQLHRDKITPADIAIMVPNSQVAALLEKYKLYPFIKEDQINTDDRCNICDSLLIEPVHLKCKHNYCLSCFLLANSDLSTEKLLCPFRCESDITRNTIRISKDKTEKIKKSYSPQVIEHRRNLHLISRAYIVLSKLGYVSDDLTVRLYRGGLEFYIRYINKMIKITVKTGIWLPHIANVKNNILKLLLDANNPPGKVGIGSLYLESDNMIYNDIDLPITYINTDTLEKLLDGIILPIQTLVASINTFSSIIPININLPVLQNIESEFLRRPKLAEVLEDLHNTDLNSADSNEILLSKINSSIDVNISSDNCFVELSKVVGRVDTNHIHTYKYLLSYRPASFNHIHNARVSVDKQNGMVHFLAIIVYGLSDTNAITEQYSFIEEASSILQQAIKVNCRQQ